MHTNPHLLPLAKYSTGGLGGVSAPSWSDRNRDPKQKRPTSRAGRFKRFFDDFS
jgi:hypothetical protein